MIVRWMVAFPKRDAEFVRNRHTGTNAINIQPLCCSYKNSMGGASPGSKTKTRAPENKIRNLRKLKAAVEGSDIMCDSKWNACTLASLMRVLIIANKS